MSGMDLTQAMSSDAGLTLLKFLKANGTLQIDTALQVAHLFKARDISALSRDPSLQVGAVVVLDDELVTAGYNHFPDEETYPPQVLADMFKDRNYKLQHIIHAEIDALNKLNKLNIQNKYQLEKATMFIYPCLPCSGCAQAIVDAGIRRVVAPTHDACDASCNICKGDKFSRWQDSFAKSKVLFDKFGVKLVEVPIVSLNLHFSQVAQEPKYYYEEPKLCHPGQAQREPGSVSPRPSSRP